MMRLGGKQITIMELLQVPPQRTCNSSFLFGQPTLTSRISEME